MLYEKKGSGHPIIFLPGLFAGGWIWDLIIESVIERGYSAIVFKEPIPVTFEKNHKKIINVLDQVIDSCDEQPYLVGNSLGALIALHYSSLNTSRVKGIVMSGAPGQIENEAGVSLSDLRTGNIKYASVLMGNVYLDKSKVPQRGIDEISRIFSDDEIFKSIVRWLSFSRKYDVPKILSETTIPIHFIWGREDIITPVAPWQVLANKLSHVSMSIIDNCGHSPMLELPQTFVEKLFSQIDHNLVSENKYQFYQSA
ncbi:alpha/beta fold hydrolase [Xenorhabdus szentirmaii]|uniref:alpha/beta fold hydrolase n=1 Tax=Xenorhabdus szentirmaii TaxID=290112 RepID=UPI001997D257|nr:alpha/beta hydrolase [Xenorhabdus sp. 5]MBD2827153.1 alpha/beta hydrolase [Xenorhabdus sp. 5]